MSDVADRDRERTAATGGPAEEERAALARCRRGDHDWSEWETEARWWRDYANPLLGERCIYRTVERRTCFWCFRAERRREEHAPPTAAPDGPQAAQVIMPPSGQVTGVWRWDGGGPVLAGGGTPVPVAEDDRLSVEVQPGTGTGDASVTLHVERDP